MSDDTLSDTKSDTQKRPSIDPETRRTAAVLGRVMWGLERRGQGLEISKDAWNNDKRDYAKKALRIMNVLERNGYTVAQKEPAEVPEDAVS